MRGFPLRRDTRGASLVEYILLVGAIALVALLGLGYLDKTAVSKTEEQAGCVATLDPSCSGAGRGSATSLASTSTSSSSSQGAANRGLGYWATSIPKGIALGAWDFVKGTATLAVSATPFGLAYSAMTGKPNAAVETVKGLGKIALWSTPPMQLYTAMGGPDPIGDMVRGAGRSIKASWQRDPGETIGRGIFEVGSAIAPFTKFKTAATIADIARAEEATQLAEASEAVRATEAASVAGDATKSTEIAAVARTASKYPGLLGTPGPGVTDAQLAALQELADETGVTYVGAGSRQTGISVHTGKPFTEASDLDLGVVGGPNELMTAADANWGNVPNVEHSPMMLFDTPEEAVSKGHFVIRPRPH